MRTAGQMSVAFERLSSEFMALECVRAMFIVSVEFQKRLTCHLCVVVFEIRSFAGSIRGCIFSFVSINIFKKIIPSAK